MASRSVDLAREVSMELADSVASQTALQDEIMAHNKVLADGALFSRNPHTFEAAATGLKQAEAALEAAEDQWLTLELAREEAENP